MTLSVLLTVTSLDTGCQFKYENDKFPSDQELWKSDLKPENLTRLCKYYSLVTKV